MSTSRLARPAKPTENEVSTQANDLNRLRSLLLADDRLQLEARNAALEDALAQVVTKDAFAERLTDELAKALKRAERNDPKAVARAISPAVVQSIRREIVNSREDMVEALYPITGRMVRAAVRDSFSSLIADLNKRLDALTSPALLKAHAKSIIFRKPASSFLIAETRDGLALERGLLIDRQSGTLVHAWQSDTMSARSEESTLVSSMFAAISTFTAENYDGPDAELRTLDLNGRQVALRHSTRHMLVVEHTGKIDGHVAAHIDTCFEQIVENVEDSEALKAIDLLDIEQGVDAPQKQKSNAAKYLFGVLAIIGLGLLAWHIWDRVWFAEKAERVTQAVTEQAPFHAPAVEVERLDRTITVRGLVPPAFELQTLIDELAQIGVTLNNQTQPIAGASDLLSTRNEMANQLAELNTDVAALEVSMREQGADLAARLVDGFSSLGEQLSNQGNTVEAGQAALLSRIEANDARLDSLRTQLIAQSNALAAQDETATELAVNLDALSAAIDQQEAAITQQSAALDQQNQAYTTLSEQSELTDGRFVRVSEQLAASLDAQRAEIDASQRTLARLQQQLNGLTGAQKTIAAAEIEAERILFVGESVPENPAGLATQIARLVGLAATYDFHLVVQGYSDQTGSDQINERVSLGRANAIVEQLIEAGLEPKKLTTEGLGAVADEDGVVARQVRLRVVEGDQ